MERRVRLLAIVKDKKFPNPLFSVEDVIDAGGYREFIEEFVKARSAIPQPASTVFAKAIKGLGEAERMLKQIRVLDPDFYFITPFGLFWQNEPILPYKETTDDIKPEVLRKYFDVFGVADRIYSLLESQPELLVIYVSPRIAKMLDIVSYIPRRTAAIIISEHALHSEVPHVRTLYPSPHYTRMLKLVESRVTSDNFPGAAIKFVAKVLLGYYQEMGEENFYRFIRSAREDPETVLDALLGKEAVEMLSERRSGNLLRFFRG